MLLKEWTVTNNQLAELAVIRHGAKQEARELALLIPLVSSLAPLTILEIGSAVGGTILIWTVCGDCNARIISVDKDNNFHKEEVWRTWMREGQSLTVIAGDSHDPLTINSVHRALNGEPINMLFIDGSHTYDGVRMDYDNYHRYVPSGGIIVLHDIAIRRADMWVWKLWEELRTEYLHVEIIDASNPCGLGILYVR